MSAVSAAVGGSIWSTRARGGEREIAGWGAGAARGEGGGTAQGEGAGAAQGEGAGDIAELYALHAKHLERIVRVDVRAPQAVIEDACQFAWSRLVFHAHRIRRESALPWLVTTAVRHAFKLVRRDGCEISLELVLEEQSEPPDCLLAPSADEVVDQRQRLAEICRLPERQQRLMWLQGLGLSYDEMALREGCTVRTVERQLLRAKRTMRTVAPV